jgi:hypothetical protein
LAKARADKAKQKEDRVVKTSLDAAFSDLSLGAGGMDEDDEFC